MEHQISDAEASTHGRSDGPFTKAPVSGFAVAGAASDTLRCMACGSADVQIVGDRPGCADQFNACCERCALLQVAPREEGVHGESPADVPLAPEIARSRAERLAVGADIKMGDAVLGFRTRGAQLLRVLDEIFGIEGHVVYDGAFPPRMPPNLTVFTENVKAYDPDVRFEAVLALNVAQTWADPLGTLVHLRRLLKPEGVLIIEVPNVLPGGEFEPGAFLTEGSTASFSPNTIRLLLLRAGFVADIAMAGEVIVLACRPDREVRALPVPFRPEMLRHPEQTGDWLLTRLASYVAAEQVRDEVLGGNTEMSPARTLIELLRQPAFDDHMVNIVIEVVHAYAEAGAFHIARMVAGSATASVPEQYRGGLLKLTEALS